jgi:hypothetical protein
MIEKELRLLEALYLEDTNMLALIAAVREARWWTHFMQNRIFIHDTRDEMLADIADTELPGWLKETDGGEG